jgi:tetratricopeptide (TPR) repeat protein
VIAKPWEVEMARRSISSPPGLLVHPLSYVRQERNWTYQDLVNLIARRVGNMSNRREKAWRWENWGVVPDTDTQLALAEELDVPVDLVFRLGWPQWLPVGEHINIGTPWTMDGCLELLDLAAGAAVLDRRGFLILGAGSATVLANQWLAVEPPKLVAALRGGRLDEALVDCFEQRLPALRQMDFALGGGSVRQVVDSELQLVTDLLANGSYTEAVGHRMFAVAAELGRIAGWTSFDAGYHAAAERYWVAALRAAHTADDRGIGANILKCMSLQRVDTDRTGEALAIARAAREGAKSAPARVVAMLTVRQARTHAVRGETADCERLLVEAERAMSRAEDEPAPPWAMYFDQAEYSAQVAACYLLLRRHAAADQWLTQTLALQPDERSRDRGTYLIWRAESVLNLGDVEHACALVAQAAPDVSTARSVRNRRRLTEIHGKLMRHRGPAVTALDEQIHSLVA